MNLTVFEKLGNLIKFMFSSFLSIELLIFCVLLFVILIVNTKMKKKVVTYCAIGVYIGILIGTVIAYNEYVLLCIKTFFKMIIKYIYFPTTAAFFLTIVLITVIMIFTLFSKKMSSFKKIFNYLFFSILYYFFMLFISLTAYNNIKIENNVNLYANTNILVIVQISNILLLVWVIFTFFYRLYIFFQKKYD